MFRDDAAPEAERYELWTRFLPTKDEQEAGARAGLWAMHSPDGLRWSYYPDQPNPRGPSVYLEVTARIVRIFHCCRKHIDLSNDMSCSLQMAGDAKGDMPVLGAGIGGSPH